MSLTIGYEFECDHCDKKSLQMGAWNYTISATEKHVEKLGWLVIQRKGIEENKRYCPDCRHHYENTEKSND